MPNKSKHLHTKKYYATTKIVAYVEAIYINNKNRPGRSDLHMCTYMWIYMCVCITIIIKEKEAINLRAGILGGLIGRYQGENGKMIEKGKIDKIIF